MPRWCYMHSCIQFYRSIKFYCRTGADQGVGRTPKLDVLNLQIGPKLIKKNTTQKDWQTVRSEG